MAMPTTDQPDVSASNDPAPGGAVQSVDRAVRVLEILAREGEAGVTEIARELGVHTSTASRLVAALLAHELVEHPRARGKYRLGVGLLRLAGATASRLDVTTQAQPVCEALAAELDETTNVAIISGDVAVNVCQAQGSTHVAAQNWVGQRTVLHATSSGKVLLAYLCDEELDVMLDGQLERFTPRTFTSPGELRKELQGIRERGWAHAIEEYEEGLNAVAAPIRAHDGSVVAAISASGPAYRLSEDRIPEASQAVSRAAAEVSRRLGYHAGRHQDDG